MNGLVLVDKPAGCTSHDVVNRWRKLANTRRVGHIGTLDPMATGLLGLVTGTATRLAQFFGAEEKTYRGEITLGCVSDTYDLDGDVKYTGIAAPPSEVVCAALGQFKGRVWQMPPPVSAKKINGVPAYKLARKNLPVELAPVEVEIKALTIDEIDGNRVGVTVVCSSGTYIRSIAHDLGQKLDCGALLSKLRRTRIGEFSEANSYTLEALADLAANGKLATAVIPSGALLPQMPSEYVDSEVEMKIRQGRDFRTSPFVVRPGTPYVKALSRSGDLIAIGELRIPNIYHPSTVL
ncbi:MAG TPA: tRNA pseudouridine(55) synthase TruB [Bryobacteraceae bacterium]|jgi:tRNA pseudouridine55 synthase|nr:tRNA pseudouridine(55) synthase TruB [Bryobacteraceae bacterium]